MVSSTALLRRATCEQPSRTTLPRDHRDCVRSGTNPDGTTRQDGENTAPFVKVLPQSRNSGGSMRIPLTNC